MPVYRLHVEDGSGRLCWYKHEDGSLRQRELLGERSWGSEELAGLRADVDRLYHVGSQDLFTLGRRLYDFIDGTERWLGRALLEPGNLRLLVDTASCVRDLPWELLADNAGFLADDDRHRMVPIRWMDGAPDRAPVENRPLRLLFLACSPLNVEPVLGFEREESWILAECRRLGVELLVEESGSCRGLRDQLDQYGAQHFDVIHLTGHAEVGEDGPRFAMEDDLGDLDPAGPAELRKALADRWPRLLFLSGCSTGKASEVGAIPSLAEELVKAGRRAVLGWALPVGDRAATALAGIVYRELAGGTSLISAVAAARKRMLNEGSPYWHLLRLYMAGLEPGPFVTPPRTKGRAPVTVRSAADEFFDAKRRAGGTVCSRERFVGRRRPLQRFLKVLRSVQGDERYHDGVLVYGLGGQGKSSFAARLCERMPERERIVHAGTLDEDSFRMTLADRLADAEVNHVLADATLGLHGRMVQLLAGRLASRPLVFVFDDFERNLDLAADGSHRCRPQALDVLAAVLQAIRQTNSASRAVITSRYDFPVPGTGSLYRESLEPLRDTDLEKKLNDLPGLGQTCLAPTLREQAIELASGNPRLLEFFDRAVQDPRIEPDQLLDWLNGVPPEDRLHRFLAELLAILDRQESALRRLVAQLGVHRLPVDAATVLATTDVAAGERHLKRAVALGVVEGSLDPATRQAWYLTPTVVLEMVEGALTDDERSAAARRGVRHLYEQNVSRARIRSEGELLEVRRLAELAGEADIVLRVASMLAHAWLASSRFTDALEICRAARQWGESWDLLLEAGRAETAAGGGQQAIRCFERALELAPQLRDDSLEEDVKKWSRLLFEFGSCLSRSAELDRALELLSTSGRLATRLGDDHSYALTRCQIAHVLYARGEVDEALRILWNEALPVFERLGDLRERAAAQGKIAEILTNRGALEEALGILRTDVLPTFERLADVRSTAVAHGKIADILMVQGRHAEALRIRREEELPIFERLGDVRQRAITQSKIADILRAAGDLDNALRIRREEELPIFERLGDVRSRAITQGAIADILKAQGRLDEALLIRREEQLPVFQRLGDLRELAITQGRIAGILRAQGQLDEALRIRREEELPIFERLGDVRAYAIAQGRIADILADQGKPEEALRIRREEQLPVFERLGDLRERAVAQSKIAEILTSRGALEEALSVLRNDVVPTLERLRDVPWLAYALMSIAKIHLKRGHTAEAAPFLERAYELVIPAGRPDWASEIGALLGQVMAATGRRQEGLAVLRNAEAGWRALGHLQKADAVAMVILKIEASLSRRSEASPSD